MRFLGFAVVTGAAIVLGACGGDKAATTDSAAAPAGDTTAMAPAPAPAAAGAMAPITGTTHEVKMIGDGAGYRFEPANLTIAAGDGVKFIMISGGPHNVAFDPAVVPAAAKAQLSANMPEQSGELSGKMMLNADETYTISFGGMAAGEYAYNCTPHLAMNMKGVITVK
ncbi:plastocyanin/azurin family copper-binding protein [Gemmatimonas sp.]|uniref:plastocyanin/azurin family copper-binding protein n=1 Tax=Gemmatimonas sp. TaxID=1962908 RepID=UPI00286A591D|nr:plastocyanin/azurin family copper-binding protein [Gemmatimonas sp.]